MWTLHESLAELCFEGLQAKVDLRHPQRGLTNLGVRSHAAETTTQLQARIFQTQLAGHDHGAYRVLDSYVRCADLVATYSASSTGDVQSQIYWRAITAPQCAAFGVEVIVSVETELLDSDPSSSVSTSLLAREVWSLGLDDEFARCDQGAMAAPGYSSASPRGVFLFRIDERLTYLEMIHPSDFTEAVMHSLDVAASSYESQYQLFREPIEKGVIRRGRLRGLFLPRQHDLADAQTLYREFLDCPPPLTA